VICREREDGEKGNMERENKRRREAESLMDKERWRYN
jgi:hypothetical protein